MIPQKILESASLKELYHFVLENRLSRKVLFSVLQRRLRQEFVKVNVDNRPRRVQELKHAYFMALLSGFDRALARGHVSRHVTERLLDTVLDGIIVNESKQDEATRHGPLMVLVSPTGRCNLECPGCYAKSDSKERASLSYETFDRIVTEKRELWDSHLTVVSGGEPFMWRDNGRTLLDLIENHPTDFFMAFTNGTLITDDMVKRMAELGNFSPAISLEGFEKETDARRGTGVYKKILKVFDSLRRQGVPFGVSVTPTSENWDTITSDAFVDFIFDEEGAVYCWSFQYMPIGRTPNMTLMISPENRFEMLKRTHRFIFEKKMLFADFWNSGIASYGCISAARPDGHFHIDWNGDITPCVFVPYAVDNIHDVYGRGEDLEAVRSAPFFRRIQEWQNEYGFKQPAERTGNWLCPCPIRDHFDVLRDAVNETHAKPLNETAADAIEDPEFHKFMVDYARRFNELCRPMWEEDFSDAPAAETSDRPSGS